jgi:hypothetical protein
MSEYGPIDFDTFPKSNHIPTDVIMDTDLDTKFAKTFYTKCELLKEQEYFSLVGDKVVFSLFANCVIMVDPETRKAINDNSNELKEYVILQMEEKLLNEI